MFYFHNKIAFISKMAELGPRIPLERYDTEIIFQAVTGVMFTTFILGMFYRSASLYHPQRRAILHLKSIKRKIKEKNKSQEDTQPFFDISCLKSVTFRIILASASVSSFGLYSPLIYMVKFQIYETKITILHKLFRLFRLRPKVVWRAGKLSNFSCGSAPPGWLEPSFVVDYVSSDLKIVASVDSIFVRLVSCWLESASWPSIPSGMSSLPSRVLFNSFN